MDQPFGALDALTHSIDEAAGLGMFRTEGGFLPVPKALICRRALIAEAGQVQCCRFKHEPEGQEMAAAVGDGYPRPPLPDGFASCPPAQV